MIRAGMSRATLVGIACVCVAVLATAPVRAQDVSARDRESASEAYDRGTAAYLAEDFSTAARWFETAHRLAPAAAALVQATRAHARAGNAQRAATLALRLRSLYPDNDVASRTAAQALRGASGLLRVDVSCDAECTIEVGGAIVGHTSFFLAPGEHEVVAEFETGRVRDTASGRAGDTVALSFEAPPAPEPTDDDPALVTPDPEPQPDDGGGGGLGGVPVAVTITSLVLTAGLGGVLVWSGVDTLDGVDAYEANPTVEGLNDGRSREERTNWLIAGTAVLGAATVILMIFTDWGGGDDGDDPETASARAVIDIQPDRAILGLTGRF